MLMRRQQFDADLDEEMRLHVELREQEQERAGLTPEDARYAALRRFGNTTLLKEESYMAWGWELVGKFFPGHRLRQPRHVAQPGTHHCRPALTRFRHRR